MSRPALSDQLPCKKCCPPETQVLCSGFHSTHDACSKRPSVLHALLQVQAASTSLS